MLPTGTAAEWTATVGSGVVRSISASTSLMSSVKPLGKEWSAMFVA
jgi:hypothetical protein